MGFEHLFAPIPLTEPERRRVEFAGGTPIVLPDGAPWRFFVPRAVVSVVHDGDGETRRMITWDFGGPGIDAETNDSLGRGFHRLLAKIDRAGNKADFACGILEAAWYLLARNYVIGQDDFEDILLRGAGFGPARRKRLYDAFATLLRDIAAQVEDGVRSRESTLTAEAV